MPQQTSLRRPVSPPGQRLLLPHQRRGRVELSVDVVDRVDGVRHRRLVVDDAHTSSPTRTTLQAEFAAHDALLRAHPEWEAPVVRDGQLVLSNPASEFFYASPTMREWRVRLVPGAGALLPVQRPGISHLPSGAALDDTSVAIYRDALDSIGVRTRAVVLQEVARRDASRGRHDARPRWVSLASGAAVPVLDAMSSVEGLSLRPHLTLVDIDPDALALAERMVAEQGLARGEDVDLLQRDLVRDLLVRSTLLGEVGAGSVDLVEALGIFEYFRDPSCVRLLREAFRLLRPGGSLVVANMLSDRRELHFNQRAIGWPLLVPRSVQELVDLVRRAGLPLDRTTISIPQDGVYAVVDVVKPAS
ncbi:methyltransferase domain-containing protein [Streptomyces sp. NP160]|uniref:class I SAM-dependent methyltransferase n=1 Tax=Streptomyces sp. NP160 TaxID=2586637 RepID=UPI00111A26D3|nr:class I SAM-dependent methyltransferase [Streptomyces sp. NP160]TNM70205.1 methyltransferase domain-containing protein [Streptomyces sp. NP160]